MHLRVALYSTPRSVATAAAQSALRAPPLPPHLEWRDLTPVDVGRVHAKRSPFSPRSRVRSTAVDGGCGDGRGPNGADDGASDGAGAADAVGRGGGGHAASRSALGQAQGAGSMGNGDGVGGGRGGGLGSGAGARAAGVGAMGEHVQHPTLHRSQQAADEATERVCTPYSVSASPSVPAAETVASAELWATVSLDRSHWLAIATPGFDGVAQLPLVADGTTAFALRPPRARHAYARNLHHLHHEHDHHHHHYHHHQDDQHQNQHQHQHRRQAAASLDPAIRAASGSLLPLPLICQLRHSPEDGSTLAVIRSALKLRNACSAAVHLALVPSKSSIPNGGCSSRAGPGATQRSAADRLASAQRGLTELRRQLTDR
eukprot:5995435-Pleurochrysis_carterae.AAC.1